MLMLLILLLLWSTIIALFSYAYIRFTTRISPTVPYAGEKSLLARLRVPVEYGLNPVKFLIQQRKELGDVFCVDLFLLKTVYVLGPKGNKAVLHASEDDLSFWEFVRTFLGPFSPDSMWGKDWMDISSKALPFGLIGSEMLHAYSNACEGLAEEIFDSWTKDPNGTVPLFKSFSYMVYSYILVIFFGRTFYQEHGEEMIPLVAEFSQIMSHPLLRVTPFALWSLIEPGSRGFYIQRRLGELIGACAREQFKSKKEGFPVDESTYISILCKYSDETFIPNIINHLSLLIFGANINIANTLPWIFLHTRHIPGSLERCRIELESEPVPSGKGVRPYLEACLRETGRLYTVLGIFRKVAKSHPKGEATLLGHKIPRGYNVACSTVVTQRDPALFEDPESWRPERFLRKEGKVYVEWFQRHEFIQFGAGEHACIGEKMTRLVIFNTIMETWLRKYDIQVVSGLKEGEGVDGVGIEADFLREPAGTPPGLGRDVMVKVSKTV